MVFCCIFFYSRNLIFFQHPSKKHVPLNFHNFNTTINNELKKKQKAMESHIEQEESESSRQSADLRIRKTQVI